MSTWSYCGKNIDFSGDNSFILNPFYWWWRKYFTIPKHFNETYRQQFARDEQKKIKQMEEKQRLEMEKEEQRKLDKQKLEQQRIE